MKTIKSATILALTLLTATQAVASTCDLTIAPEIIERQNSRVVETVHGRRDNLRRPGHMFGVVMGAILLAPMQPISLPYFMGYCADGRTSRCQQGRPGIRHRMARARALDAQNGQAWYADQFGQVYQECNDYIRENFADDIISDDGHIVLAHHYSCSQAEIRNYRSHFQRVEVEVLHSDPVYREFSATDVVNLKCHKINQCMAQTTSVSEIDELQQMQIQLGCQ